MRGRIVAGDEVLDHRHAGAVAEFLGDLHVIATDDTDAPEYAQAMDQYRTATDIPLAECKDVKLLSTDRTLPEWLEYKRTHLPTVRDELLDIGISAYAFSQLSE